MKDGTPLKEQLDKLNTIWMDLKDVHVKVEDEGVALILLCSLQPSYDP